MSVQWTAADIAKAQAMWASGLSVSKIGIALGRSRGSVVGLADRNRDTFPRRRHKQAKSNIVRPKPKSKANAPTIVKQSIAAPTNVPIRFADTEAHSCRYPVSGDPGPDMLVCGAVVPERESGCPVSRSYCDYHMKIVTRKVK